MNGNTKICRLCLKIIEKDAIYFPLTNNNAIIQNLNLISFVTIKNLPLTEHPVICDQCDNKLIELANFKENIISNELQIQSNQQNNVNPFLEDISKDFNKLCRLCLNASQDTAEVQKKWEDCKEIFVKCNIHLNLNIPEPSTICNLCDTTLQSLCCFVLNCAKNEQLIANKANKNKNLSLEDVIKVETIEIEIPKNVKSGEDNNNVSQQPESPKKETSVMNIAKTITEIGKCNEKNFNTSFEKISPEGNASKLNKLDRKCSDLENLSINRTPNTYTRNRTKRSQTKVVKGSTSKLNILSYVCIRQQDEPSTSKLTASEISIVQFQNESLEDTCIIDASPVSNIADITLDMSLGRILEVDNREDEKNNVTKELIKLLESTEEHVLPNEEESKSACTSKQYRHTEELLKVLEDDTDVNVLGLDNQINDIVRKYKGKCKKTAYSKTKTQEGIVKISSVLNTVSDPKSPTTPETGDGSIHSNEQVKKIKPVSEKKFLTIQETVESSSHSNNKESPEKIQNVKNFKGKRTSTSFIKKSVSVKGNSDPKGKTSIAAEGKGHNLRQKTIVTSFRDMLSMKPLKKKQESSSVNKKTAENLKIQLRGNEDLPQGTHKEREKGDFDNQSSSTEEQTSKKCLVDDENTCDKSQIPKKIGTKKDVIATMKKNKIEEGQGNELSNNLEKVETTVKTKALESVREVNGAVEKKRSKRKGVLETQKEDVPKKRAKRLVQKKLLTSNAELSTTENEESKTNGEKSPVKKRQFRASKKTLDSKRAKSKDTNEDPLSANSKETDLNTSDSDESETEGKTSDKPVVVIIRRNKTKNKAQTDKTWHELTGKPADVEADNVPRKRGRPPLPEALKKPKKEKPTYYMCTSCSFKSISKNIITQHLFIHNVVDDVSHYKCNQCEFRANKEETLAQHKISHLMLEIIYKCVFCEYSHKKKSSTMYHTLRHDDKDIANMFYCLAINQISEEEQYECFQCDYQNTEEAVMPDHVMDHQVETIKNPIMTKFSCKDCLYKSKFEHLFKRHQEMHEVQRKKQKVVKKEIIKPETDEAPPTPSEESQTQDELGEVRTVYSCNKCDFLTYNKRSLTNHKGLKHTRHAPPTANLEARRRKRKLPQPDEIYQCNECDYSTQKKPHLTRHMIIHRSKENMEFYECTHCIFETKHRRSYKRHMEMKHKVIV